MAAPVTDDWGAVRDSAVSLQSISEAARKHGVSIDAACQRARREKWPVGRRPAKALAEAREAHAQAIITANPNAVRNVRTTADVVSNTLAEDSGACRSAILRGGRKVLESWADRAKVSPEKAMIESADVASITKAVSVAGSWAAQGNTSVRISMFAPGQVVDVEAEVVRELPDSQ